MLDCSCPLGTPKVFHITSNILNSDKSHPPNKPLRLTLVPARAAGDAWHLSHGAAWSSCRKDGKMKQRSSTLQTTCEHIFIYHLFILK